MINKNSLTKKEIEILTKIKEIDAELLRLSDFDMLSKYNKGKLVHIKQLEFHKNQHKNRWVFGGNRSGKTECGAVEAIWMARGIHPFRQNKPNVSGWVVSLSTQVQRDVAQNKILYYLNPDWIDSVTMLQGKKDSMEFGVIDTIFIKNIFGGISKIGFKSCDQGREKFQGTSLDFVWFDEEPPKDIYLECKMRVLDKCGDIFGTMTPLKGLSWVYNTIYLNENNDKDIWHIKMQWEDNPFLDKNEIISFSNALSSSELNSRKFGNFDVAYGIVYPEFCETVNVIEPFEIPPDWQDCLSIDPGLSNPLSCHWYACDGDGNVYVVAEHFEANKSVEYHANKIKEISSNINWKKNKFGYIDALIDSASNQHTLNAEKSVAELFYDFGINVNTKVNKDLFTGINRVKTFLKNANNDSKLFIFNTCRELIKEFKSYFYGANDVPIKKDDHCLDELRYYIMNKPDLPIVKLEKSLVTKNKEKLIKQLYIKRKNYY